MAKTMYVVMCHSTDNVDGYSAVSPLLKTEEEAIREMFKYIDESIIEDDEQTLDLARESFSETDYVDLRSLGYPYVFKILDVDVIKKKELTYEQRVERYEEWVNQFISKLKIPKVGKFYPREFCKGALLCITDVNPAWCMEVLGFQDYIFPINWEEFFTTGHAEFTDNDSSKITFDFRFLESEWVQAELTVRVDDLETTFDWGFDVEDVGGAARQKRISFFLGDYFMNLLMGIHPMLEPDYDRQ